LDPRGYRQLSYEIRNVLTWGVLLTWLGVTLVVRFIFGLEWAFALLAASLVIVTGPTVVGPLLKRIRAKSHLHQFLHWEGVLIDPIGVFIALLCYEWIIGHNAVLLFFIRFATGLLVGTLSGIILAKIVQREWISDELLNIFMLAAAVGIFILSDLIIPESGLLSVTIAGFVLGYVDTPRIEQLKQYKAQLIELLIGLLFVLLAAKLDVAGFWRMGWRGLLAVALVMLVIRPVNIWLTTWRSEKFGLKEKIFLSWVAPRGIVAASMASLFALNLTEQGKGDAGQAAFLETFTYSVILGTVVLQGFSARP
jgi:NhaP-type Na+/H+ or K+/H+ antiporter